MLNGHQTVLHRAACAYVAAHQDHSSKTEGLTQPCTQRANMEEVKRHPWFNAQLPDGALTMNDYYIAPVPYLGEARSRSQKLL